MRREPLDRNQWPAGQLSTFLRERFNFLANTPVPAGVVGSNGFSNALYKSDYGLLDSSQDSDSHGAPKSWGGKTVVRGAFDISSYLEGTGTNLRLTQNPPFTPAQVEAPNVATGHGVQYGNCVQQWPRLRQVIRSSAQPCSRGAGRSNRLFQTNGMFRFNTKSPTTLLFS